MRSVLQDVAYAIRGLRNNPGFAAVAVLTLALGIGANTAIFSVVNGVILRPLAYEDPGRLVAVRTAFPGMGFDEFWMSAPEYEEAREWATAFENMGGYREVQSVIGGAEEPVRVTGAWATASLFQTMGVPARLGRTFTDAEDRPGSDAVVVLSDELWRRSFGGDPGLVGEEILVGGRSRTVLGIMPPGFDVEEKGIEAWVPLALDPTAPRGRANHFLNVVGRLKQGVGLQQARSEMSVLLARWEGDFPDDHSPRVDGHPILLFDLHEKVVGPTVRASLLLLLGAVTFVLLIAVANVGNLMLARAESRQKEIAVRMALGAGAGRLVRQFLTEAVLLSLLGGAVGIGLAFVGLGTLQRMGAGTLPRITEIGIDGTVLLFTLGAAVVTGLLFGLAPLLHLHSARAGAALKEGGLRTTGGRGRSRLRSLLVVSEIALAVVLVVGAGLLIRSLESLHGVDPGFEPEGLLTFEVLLSSNSYPEAPEQMQFLDLLLDRVREIPGVQEAAVMSGLPPQREVNANDMDFEGLEATEDGPAHNVDYWQFVSRDYFEVMGIEIEEGRGFEGMDDSAGTPVVLINRRLADVFYPGENPIGRRIAPPQDSTVWFTIVGIARDVKQGGLSEPTGTEVYYHAPQTALGMGYIPREMNMVLRLDGDPGTILPQLRDAVWSLDPSLPLAGLETMEDHLGATLARPRFLTLVLTLFAGIALALAAVGTYGVISYGVAERNREIGIRMAMGAESGEVLGMILRGGSRLAAIGLLIGIAGALALSDLMESLLFGVSATDPVAFVLAPAVLALVALAACVIPARRATQVDPVNALKGE